LYCLISQTVKDEEVNYVHSKVEQEHNLAQGKSNWSIGQSIN